MTWVKGTSGNPLGGVLHRSKPFKQALIMELLKDGSDMPRLRRIISAVCDKAEAGDIPAAKFISESLDGKAVQVVESTINDRRDLSQQSPEEIDRRIAELQRRRTRMIASTAKTIEG